MIDVHSVRGSASADPALQQNAAPPSSPLVIEPVARGYSINFRELWDYRGLFLFLAWRDIKVRYAQTVLGAGWAVLQPLLTTVVFTIVFGMLVQVPSDGSPYAIFALAALVPWTYFSSALAASSNSLVSSTNLLTKVYFPRLVIPFVPVVASLVDFGIAFLMLMLAMLAFGATPSVNAVVVLPVLITIMMLTAAGVGCWLSALNIQYRDVKHIVPFLLQVWMYASPIVYPMSLVPERYRLLYSLNPMVGVVEGFRAVIIGTQPVPWSSVAVALGISGVIFFTGTLFFRRMEHVFADVA